MLSSSVAKACCAAYINGMKVRIVATEDSGAVSLPDTVLEQSHIADEAELSIEAGRIVLAPVAKSRADWASAFAASSDDELSTEDLEWLEAPLETA